MITFADNSHVYISSLDPGSILEHTHTYPITQSPAFQDSLNLAATNPYVYLTPVWSTFCFILSTRDTPFSFFLAKSHLSS